MNARSLNLVLLAVCLGLTGTLVFTLQLLRKTREATVVEFQTEVVTNTVKETRIAVRKINASNYLAALAKRPLSWMGLESTNYFAFMENLRGFGCPEETIRDIILTDIAKIYSGQRAGLLSGAEHLFWEADGLGLVPEVQSNLVALDRERDELVREVLGVDFETEMLKYWGGDMEQTGWKLSFLSEEKRGQVSTIRQKYADLERAIYASAGGVLSPEDMRQLTEIEQQQAGELAGLLDPRELEDYQLRFSPAAETLRAQLQGFNPTEEEFRSVFRIQDIYAKTLDTALAAVGQPLAPEARELAERQGAEVLEQELRKRLGPERFEQFARSQDAEYQQLLTVTSGVGLPENVANEAYEMRNQALLQKEQVESNPNLTFEQRERALLALASETQRSLAALMGEDPFRTYRTVGGEWMDTLSVGSEPPPEPEPPVPVEFPPLPFSPVPY